MRDWLSGASPSPAITVIGAPISRASISPSQAWATPGAFREALARFPTWDGATRTDIAVLAVADAGDVVGDRDDPDARAAHERIAATVGDVAGRGDSVIAVIGGDNSLTRPAMTAVMSARAHAAWGLLTLDAHHDCRPADGGSRNGTPVRELIEAGLDGRRVAQVGIHPLGNAREHAAWAASQGVWTYSVEEVRAEGVDAVVVAALDDLQRSGVERIYVDFDVDVVDRAAAPGCPASLPGGIAAADLLAAARLLGRDARVDAMDLCEVDAMADVAGITVRLMAAAFTAFASGLAQRVGDVTS
jgi:formiminoglutamase